MGKTVGELHAMFIKYEKGLPKKVETLQVMMIKGGKIQKSNKKSLKAKCKGKANGKGNDKQVYIPKPKNPKPSAKEHPAKDDTCHHCKEVGHYKRNCPAYLAELIKKKKQVSTANNFHYAPSITRGVVSVHRLVENDFVQSFTDYETSVSKNNVFYFNVIPSNGIYEIDMHDLVPNVNSIYNVSTKRAKHNLDSTYLWYCRLAHIRYPKETMGYYFNFPPENKIVVARYAEFFNKNLITQEVSGRAINLEEIQDEDTSPSEITSEIPMEVEETFLPVGDIRAIRILISIAAFYDYEIWQMDVKTSFFNGYLDEDIYMVQPEGFVDPNHPRKIWRSGIYSWNKKYRDRPKRLIGLGQNAYMDKILKRYKMDNLKRVYIPMQEILDLNKTQGASTPREVKRMQNVHYASAVGFIINPKVELRVDCYCNAGFETDIDDMKSQTEYVFIF
nr:zinc finger, CCHC-type [Tanacetum cinerariifolium]